MALLFILCSFGVSFPLSFFFTFSYYYVRLRAFFRDTWINWVLKKKYTQAHKIRKRCTQARHQKKQQQQRQEEEFVCKRPKLWKSSSSLCFVCIFPSLQQHRKETRINGSLTHFFGIWFVLYFVIMPLHTCIANILASPIKVNMYMLCCIWYIKWAAIIIRNTEST